MKEEILVKGNWFRKDRLYILNIPDHNIVQDGKLYNTLKSDLICYSYGYCNYNSGLCWVTAIMGTIPYGYYNYNSGLCLIFNFLYKTKNNQYFIYKYTKDIKNDSSHKYIYLISIDGAWSMYQNKCVLSNDCFDSKQFKCLLSKDIFNNNVEEG